MKRLTAWVTGVAGGLAAYRLFKRPSHTAVVAEPDPAEALRAKLAETKSVAEPPPASEEPADPDARRRAVHERGREAINEMKGDRPS